MTPYDIIKKKRDGFRLSREEIEYFVLGFTRGEIPDYQMSAWLMAVFMKGMDDEETKDLTLVMIESGDKVDLSSIPGVKVDKHSTGGVGDTTSLLIGPIIAAAGVPFAKMSGRGLAHTGGTLDKLESIPGFNVNLSEKDFVEQVKRIGIALISPTGDLAPADKKMYALRDVTATVDSIPLIAGSIMSKKLAAGTDAILLDVKCGRGAFMTTCEDARRLAETLVNIGKLSGKATRAVITDMDQPLASHIGNALEVKEVFDILREPGKSSPLREVTLELCAHLLEMAGLFNDLPQARTRAEELLSGGQALQKMKEFIAAQGGNAEVVEKPELMAEAEVIADVQAPQSGNVSHIDVMKIGILARDLGAGRVRKEDSIDPAVGLVLHKRVGDSVEKGERLATIHASGKTDMAQFKSLLAQCFSLTDEAAVIPPLILDTVR
ncbi:MAG: pyrimidine-nucleoside phosphorylase [Candidatus Xenobiia bacterium LiM19]